MFLVTAALFMFFGPSSGCRASFLQFAYGVIIYIAIHTLGGAYAHATAVSYWYTHIPGI